jgi:tripartite-type tricarboxylate transporter receptor subunit TctC
MTAFRARIGTALFAAVLAAGVPTTDAKAQAYPNRPVTIMLPLAAGSGMDTIARLYGEQLAQNLGKPIVIENRPGASLMLAAAAVATAPPDGYTLLVSTAAPMAINATLYKQINFNPEKDFEPISLYLKSPFVLVVDPALPVKTVPELIKYIKESGKQLTYSSPGAGLAQHLSMEFMKQKFGLEITHVPYRNTPQSISDITAGHVNMGFAEIGASLPLIMDGKLRALAVSSSTRLGVLPDVPPFGEAVGTPDFEAVSWHLLLAPAGTPKEIVGRLHQDMKKIMAAPDMQKKVADLGLIPLDPPSLQDTLAYVASERTKWSALVRKLGLEGTQ